MSAQARITLIPDGAAEPVPAVTARVERELVHPVGRAEVVLTSATPVPELGARVVVGIEQGEDSFDLLSGQVARIAGDQATTRITVLEPLAALNAPRVTQAYSNSTAGDIISDLCGQAEVETGLILPGNFHPNIVLRANRTALQHAIRLADLSGMALVCGTDGTLGMISLALPVPEGALPADRAAARLTAVETMAGSGETRVIGEGLAGSRGPSAANWPVSDTTLIEAGPADAGNVTTAAALKSLAEVTNLNLAKGQRLAARGGGLELVTPLVEDLALGSVLAITEGTIPVPRLGRLERIAVQMSGAGVRAIYGFSDLEVA